MTAVEHFLRHAAECESMAQFSRDPQSKAVWRGMAERWSRGAELAKKHDAQVPRRKLNYRSQSEALAHCPDAFAAKSPPSCDGPKDVALRDSPRFDSVRSVFSAAEIA